MQHWVCAMRSLVLGTEPLRRTAASLVGGPDLTNQAAVLQRCLSQLQDAQVAALITPARSSTAPAPPAGAAAQPMGDRTKGSGSEDTRGAHSSSSSSSSSSSGGSGTDQPPDQADLNRADLGGSGTASNCHPGIAGPDRLAHSGNGSGSGSGSRPADLCTGSCSGAEPVCALAPWAYHVRSDEAAVRAALDCRPGSFADHLREYVQSCAVDLLQ